MRITVSHNKPKQQVREAVDRSLDQVVNGIAGGPVQFTNQHKQWTGDTMNFGLIATMGFIHTPIKGSIEIGDTHLTIDVDLGLLEKLIPQDAVRTGIEQRVKGLLT